jgi:cytoskeletal protein CcmA (bactofilin family)
MSESPTTKQTVLEEGTEFEGSIRSQCPITVSGTLKGDIAAPSLTITLSGSVQGQVKVSNLKSEGEIAGEIDAESVELSGHVSDQTTIRASSLQVKLSQNGSSGKLQVTFGNCDLHVGDAAAKSLGTLSKAGSRKKGVDEQPKAERESWVETMPEPELTHLQKT